MIREQGTVVEVQPGRARVATERSSACGHCKARGACSGLGGGREARVWVADPVGVASGDEVIIEVPEGTVVRASILLYLLPVLALLLGALVGNALAPRVGLPADLLALALGLGGLALALAGARMWGKQAGDGPRIVGKA